MVQSTKKRLFSKSLALAMIAALSITTGASAVTHGVGANDGGKNSNVAIGNGAQATGQSDSVAVGYNSKATGAHSQAIGNYASAITQSTAIGTSAAANHQNSVALGIHSATDRGNSVSVGDAAEGIYRQVTNVAAGEKATDAANVGQMRDADAALKADITNLGIDNQRQDVDIKSLGIDNQRQDADIKTNADNIAKNTSDISGLRTDVRV